MSAAVVYFLFAVSGSNAPTLLAVAQFPDRESCTAKAEVFTETLADATPSAGFICVASDALQTLAQP